MSRYEEHVKTFHALEHKYKSEYKERLQVDKELLRLVKEWECFKKETRRRALAKQAKQLRRCKAKWDRLQRRTRKRKRLEKHLREWEIIGKKWKTIEKKKARASTGTTTSHAKELTAKTE